MGYIGLGVSHFLRGDIPEAIKLCKEAHDVSADQLYKQVANLLLGICYVQNKQFNHAEGFLQTVIDFSREYGCEWAGTPASLFMGVVLISSGKMSAGFGMIQSTRKEFITSGKKPYLVLAEYILGKIYLQMAEAAEPIAPAMMLKNIGFLIQKLPFASKKAEQHLQTAVKLAKNIGAQSVVGQACLDLGLLYKSKKKSEQAKFAISEAITIFEQCGADVFEKQAREALKTIG